MENLKNKAEEYWLRNFTESEALLTDSSERAIRLRRLAFITPYVESNTDIAEYEVESLLCSAAAIIDNSKSINNFASSSLEIASKTLNFRNQSTKWESSIVSFDESKENSDNSEYSQVVDNLRNLLKNNYSREKISSLEEEPKIFEESLSKSASVLPKNPEMETISDHQQKSIPPQQQQPISIPQNPLIRSLTGKRQSKFGLPQISNKKTFKGYDKSNEIVEKSAIVPRFRSAAEEYTGKQGTRFGKAFKSPLSPKRVERKGEKEGIYLGIDSHIIDLIKNEIMDRGMDVHWDDIAGLEFVKTTIKEIVVFPLLRPDIFTGLRGPPKGLLLFGPPGTGKTLIGKCIAAQSKSTFFAISASSLTSKWVGEGEKMVRALFAVAKVHQPSVIFIDEIDSLLTSRSDNEHESSRRIKTEFLVQLDGASTIGEEKILVVGATNRPQDLDEAARRRLVKRLYVPLPEASARKQIIHRLLNNQLHSLTDECITLISELTEGYSGADMNNLCKEAAMGPIRSLDYSKIETLNTEDVRAICIDDFHDAIRRVKASVSSRDLEGYINWDNTYGAAK